jgi:hypothetical protein
MLLLRISSRADSRYSSETTPVFLRSGYGIHDFNLIASTPAIGHQQFGKQKNAEYLVTRGCDFSNETFKK